MSGIHLESYIALRKRDVEEALSRHLPPEHEPPSLMHQAMRYAVFSGGKRLRAVLCMAAAEAVGASAESALVPAAAVELLHTYTLVHDDLPCMDDDDLRRGKPTVHVVYGEANAILAGDALQALAFEVLVGGGAGCSDTVAARCVRELAQAAGSRGVVGGQCEDLAACGRRLSLEELNFIHQHKTADLFRAAVRMGALAGGGSERQLDALGQYGMHLGLAFQITDDLLDAGGQPVDQAEASCLQVYSPEAARVLAAAGIEAAVAALGDLQSPGSDVLEAVARFVLDRCS